MKRIIFLAILFSICTLIESQKINKCTSKSSCSACIQTPDCAWCSNPDYGDRPRCYQPDLRTYQQCDEAFVVCPDNEQIMIAESESHLFSRSRIQQQIRPQHIKLRMRISKENCMKVES